MDYLAEVKGIRETDKGTDLIVHIPNKLVGDKISKYKHCGTISTQLSIDDRRRITDSQRKKIYATIGDISKWMGEDPEWMKVYLKWEFCKLTNNEYFSFSRKNSNAASIDTSKKFINFLIDLILKENIPLSEAAIIRTDDINNYLYGCIKYKKCAICQLEAEIHHMDAIGMGRDRTSVDDRELRKIALCREHHTEAHMIGIDSFNKKYHVYGLTIKSNNYKEWYDI